MIQELTIIGTKEFKQKQKTITLKIKKLNKKVLSKGYYCEHTLWAVYPFELISIMLLFL